MKKKNSRNQAEKFWDRTANSYDREEEKAEQTYLNIIEKTRKYLKLSDVVLDYGCGTWKAKKIKEEVRISYYYVNRYHQLSFGILPKKFFI